MSIVLITLAAIAAFYVGTAVLLEALAGEEGE